MAIGHVLEAGWFGRGEWRGRSGLGVILGLVFGFFRLRMVFKWLAVS